MTNTKRVYEVAKDLSKSNKEMVDIISAMGIEIRSHMSVLSEEEIKKITKHVAPKKEEPKKDDKKIVSKTTAVPVKKPTKSAGRTKQIIRKNYRDEAKAAEKELEEAGIQGPKAIIINVPITVAGLADQISKSASDIIMKLMRLGIMANINQNIDESLNRLFVLLM